ncbi:MAG: hypothetical protein PHO86_06015 [Bacilli bacterium]|nr:hypothetical protein [Bacilli bacterium]
MIRPINISPLNTSQTLEYKCPYCKKFGILNLTNIIININNEGNVQEDLTGYTCPHCGNDLFEENNK